MHIQIGRFFAGLLGAMLLVFAGCAHEPVSGLPPPAPKADFEVVVLPQTLRSDEVGLYWDKVGEGPAIYRVVCDGRQVGSTSKTHYTIKGLEPDHEHIVSVSAEASPYLTLRQSGVLHIRTKPREQVVNIEDFGAIGDGATLNTQAIQAAITACPPNGVVLIPQGIFLSGAIYLKGDMTLHIAAGGVLKGSANPKDYEPFVRNRFEGWEMDTHASLINAGKMDGNGLPNLVNLSIRGEGRISGGGKALSDAIIQTHGPRSRGRLICLMNCANVDIQGLTLEETPCWTLHYIYSENITCHDLAINSDVRNGDGIDPDSSKNSYIINCTFDTGDDCIAIKSGKNPEGNVINRPTLGVRIIDCNFKRGHGISIGSEMSGGVSDVLVQDCIAGNLLNGMQIKATKDRGNVVENVTVRDCDLQQITIYTKLNYNNDGDPAPSQPYFRNFHFENIDMSKAGSSKPAIVVNGFPAKGHRTRDVSFKNIKLPRGAIVEVDQAEDITFTDVLMADGQKPLYKITQSDRILYNN